jgi:hypothetical protein
MNNEIDESGQYGSKDYINNEPDSFKKSSDIKSLYKQCIIDSQKRFDNKNLKLCPRGYCTAKHIFEVYPSAYANGYATSVCKGLKPDVLNKTYPNKLYITRLEKKKKGADKNELQRWYSEEWVNLCEKDPKGPGGFAVCGTGKGVKNPNKYPYCRAYKRLPGTEVVTAQELQQYYPDYIKKMCKKKRSLKQGIDGKPTKIHLPKKIIQDIKNKRLQIGGNILIDIPDNVRKSAILGLEMIKKGFKGGTETGWNRAKQLAYDNQIDLQSLSEMRTWYARHGPDAKNGGTSYPGYCKWIYNNKPQNKDFNKYRGAVSWLIWGGSESYLWLKQPDIRNLLETHFPKRKKSNTENNLY